MHVKRAEMIIVAEFVQGGRTQGGSPAKERSRAEMHQMRPTLAHLLDLELRAVGELLVLPETLGRIELRLEGLWGGAGQREATSRLHMMDGLIRIPASAEGRNPLCRAGAACTALLAPGSSSPAHTILHAKEPSAGQGAPAAGEGGGEWEGFGVASLLRGRRDMCLR